MRRTSADVFVILLNWNGLKDTTECITSLLKSTYKKIQIVVVDNASKNNEGNRLQNKFPQIALIKNSTNFGFCGGNNTGIRHALSQDNCKYIFVLNNDTVVPEATIEILLNKIASDKKVAISPAALYHNSNRIQNLGGKLCRPFGLCMNFKKNHIFDPLLDDISPDYLSGCAILTHKNFWEELRGFDPDYFAWWEDVDLSLRAKRAGYTLLATSKAYLYHKHSSAFGKRSLTKFYLLTRNSILFAHKNLRGIHKGFFILHAAFYHLLLGVFQTRSVYMIRPWLLAVLHGFSGKIHPMVNM